MRGRVGGIRFTWRRLAGLVGEDGMRQNALFQLRKRSRAAARKDESLATSEPARSAERDDHFVVRNGVRCAGVHLIVDLYGADKLDDLDHIETTLRRCVDASGATLLHIHLHHFAPNGGISGVAVLAESHISIHSWPERHYAAVDIFMCGSANADACVPVLRESFGAERVVVSELLRGQGAA
jgi:S-adenosylmethionine decarboxylase